jgi:GNAT superfamily N-acetyltransferase
MVEGIQIRPVRPGDEVAVVNLIRELADFEKLLDEMVAAPGDLREALFAENPAAEALIGEFNGAPVAFALFFYTFSTFEGRKSLYLEDLYVKLEYWGRCFGTKSLKTLARIAVERDCNPFRMGCTGLE